jgi:putative ABC transport system permease protein
VKLQRLASAIGGAAASSVLLLIYLAAWLLAPFRLGRLLRRVSVPRMQDHKLRTTLTVLGIGLGVAVLVAVVIVNDSVVRGVAATVDEIAGKTDLQISAGTSGFSEELLAQTRTTPGVYKAAPIMQQTVTIRDAKARSERLLVLGVDMLEDQDEYFRSYGSNELSAIRNDPLAFLNASQNILISRAVAQRFGYKLHDKIALATGTGVLSFDIWGFLDDVGVGRAFGGAVAVMYYQAMQVAFDRGQNIDRIDLAVTPGTQIGPVEARLQHTLGGGFIVERPSRKGDRVNKMLLGVRSGLTIASLLALLVGAFLIHNTMAISVVQRKREIGILRALGSTQGELVTLLTLEGGLLGAVGSLLGIGIGIGLSRGLLNATSQALNQTYLQLAATDVRIDPKVLVGGVALGTLAATLASALPARRAAHDKPAETLRTASVLQPAPYPNRASRNDLLAILLAAGSYPLLRVPPIWQLPLGAFAAALTLLLAAALLLPRLVQLVERGLRPVMARWGSVEARLANQNLPRDLGRTAITASALMSGVALAVSFGIFTHSFATTLNEWVDQTLPGDLFITQAAAIGGTSMRNVPMADTLNDPLAAIPQVETVRRVRIVEMPYRGTMLKAVSTDIDVFLRHAKLSLLEGEQPEIVGALQHGGILVSENFSRHFHTHRGDRVELSTHDGTREFLVAGVFVDYTSDVGSVLIDRPTYVAAFRDSRVDTYELHLHKHQDAELVRRRVNAEFGVNHDLFVLTNHEFKAEVQQTTDQIFSLVRALELVALIVAVLGIVNAQLANVLDRVREIGVLRALGMLRRQVSRIVVIEATLVGCIGTLAGVLLGMALAVVLLDHVNLVQTGWYFPYHLSVSAILEVSALTVPAAALAGFYPAREAARLVVTDALEYE